MQWIVWMVCADIAHLSVALPGGLVSQLKILYTYNKKVASDKYLSDDRCRTVI